MGYINVKAAEGRIAFDMPVGGKKIPSDKFIRVRETSYVRRLIDKHGDLIEDGKAAAKHAPAKAAAPVAKPILPVA